MRSGRWTDADLASMAYTLQVGREAMDERLAMTASSIADLAEKLRAFLEQEEVALDEPFIDMGLDSIVAGEWVRALNTRYGTNITVTTVYDHPTIFAFAAFLARQRGIRAPAPTVQRPSLDNILQRVQQGDLDIAEAYQLLQQIDA